MLFNPCLLFMNVTSSLVRKCERGAKWPSGASLKLLSLRIRMGWARLPDGDLRYLCRLAISSRTSETSSWGTLITVSVD